MKFLFSTRLQAEGLQIYQKYAPFAQHVPIYNKFLDILGTSISENTF